MTRKQQDRTDLRRKGGNIGTMPRREVGTPSSKDVPTGDKAPKKGTDFPLDEDDQNLFA